MKAIVQDRYGSYDTLSLADIDPPVPAAGEVLVRVHAAGVDPGTWHLMTGLPRVARLAFGITKPRDRVRGREFAGRVSALGAGVTGFAVGDDVFGVTTRGAFAEYATAKVQHLTRKPDGPSYEEAAVLPVSGCTALAAVRRTGIRPGQRVLVLGAGGGVGTYAVQLAVNEGAEVTGVCSTSKVDLVRSLGAAHVVDYTRGEPQGQWDVVLDTGGMRPLRALRRLLTPTGTVGLIGGEDDGTILGGNQTRLLRALAVNPFTKQRLAGVLSSENRADLDRLAAGTARPVLDRTFPLAEAGAALRYLMEGHARGKVALTV